MLERAAACAEARRIMRKLGVPYVCINCGIDWVKLDAHHKDRDWRNNDPENLEYLCKDCHNKEHGKVPKTVPVSDTRRKIQYTDEEILGFLREAKRKIGYAPNQTEYSREVYGGPTVKTVLKRRNWQEWIDMI